MSENNEFTLKTVSGNRFWDQSNTLGLNVHYDKKVIFDIESMAISRALSEHGARAMMDPKNGAALVNAEMDKMIADAGSFAALHRSVIAQNPKVEAAFYVASIEKGAADINMLTKFSDPQLLQIATGITDRISTRGQFLESLMKQENTMSPTTIRIKYPQADKIYDRMHTDHQQLVEVVGNIGNVIDRLAAVEMLSKIERNQHVIHSGLSERMRNFKGPGM